MKERMQTPHRGLTHQGRSVGPNEFPWVELVFEALNRLPRNMRSSRCVDNDIFVGCFNPDDFVHGHEQNAFVILNREPGQPLTGDGAGDSGVQPPNRSLNRRRKALLVEWLAEIVNGLDFEGSHCVLAVTGYEDKERRSGGGDLINHSKPIEARHLNIDKHDIRRQLPDLLSPLNTIRTLSNDFYMGLALEQFAQIMTRMRLILNNEDASRHCCRCRAGL